MQIEPHIRKVFGSKGYFGTCEVTKREFHILMNSIMTRNELFSEDLTNELWKQAENEKTMEPPGQLSPHSREKQRPIKIEFNTVIRTLDDAIQILTNRIIQLNDQIQCDLLTIKKLENSMQYAKVSKLEAKIAELRSEVGQSERDFEMLTQPFLTQKEEEQFRRQCSLIRNSSSLDRNWSIRKQSYESNGAHNFDLKMKELTHIEEPKLVEGKRCSLIFLSFWTVLELTVTLYKFNFVNLLVIVMGFLVLSAEQFKVHLSKITIGSTLLTVLLDAVWLWLYSVPYLNAQRDFGLKHGLKPFFQYIWFITLLSIFIKIIYVCFLRQYDSSGNELIDAEKKYRHSVEAVYGMASNEIPQNLQNKKATYTPDLNDHIRKIDDSEDGATQL